MLDPDLIHERRTLSFSSLISACEYLPGLDKNIRLSVQSRDAIIDISPSVDTGGGVTNDTDGNDQKSPPDICLGWTLQLYEESQCFMPTTSS